MHKRQGFGLPAQHPELSTRPSLSVDKQGAPLGGANLLIKSQKSKAVQQIISENANFRYFRLC